MTRQAKMEAVIEWASEGDLIDGLALGSALLATIALIHGREVAIRTAAALLAATEQTKEPANETIAGRTIH